jgi:deoxyribonuclease V
VSIDRHFTQDLANKNFHSWDVDEAEAEQIQLRLAPLIVSVDDFGDVALIGGVSIRQPDPNTVLAAIAVLDVQTMKLVESVTATTKSKFQYVSGLRAFQAGPAILAAFDKLGMRPDLVLWDGHGMAHPRRCGLASHLGILLNVPSVGIAEELVYGTCNVVELPQARGSHLPVRDPEDGTVIAAAVRTRSDVRPIYASVGHRVSLESAINIALQCTPRYRMPEPPRQARILSKKHYAWLGS